MADGLRLKTTTNLDQVLRQFDDWSEQTKTIAMVTTLNKLGEQANVVGKRAIRKTYGLTIDQLEGRGRRGNPYFSVVEATNGVLEFKVVAEGLGFPMSLFLVGPIPKEGKGPVYVRIKGKKLLIRHGFMHNGQVYARGTYGGAVGAVSPSRRSGQRGRRKRPLSLSGRPLELTGAERINRFDDSIFEPTGERFGRFAYGRNRFPISLLRSTSPPAALMNKDVIDAMNERIKEQAPKVLKNALKFASRIK